MQKLYLFDVDGTLTPPRCRMDNQFAEFFEGFAHRHGVYLVSGSDIGKIREQVPENILNQCMGIYACSGTELWEQGRLVYRMEHSFPSRLVKFAEAWINASSYAVRTGNHVEHRTGMLNVSVVGRNASPDQRNAYFAWDAEHGERRAFLELLAERFPDYEVSAGGEISIDIVPRGWTKAAVKRDLDLRFAESTITFFGDRMQPGGNDYPLVTVLRGNGRHMAMPVESYHDTWDLLRWEEVALAA